MTHSFTNLHYHLVFSAQGFLPLINPEWEPRLHEYLGGAARGLKGTPIEINGMPDHVHLLIGLHQDMSVATFLEKLKSNSTGWVKRNFNSKFGWQTGYGAFSVSESRIEYVRRYIRNQKKHHSKMTFKEEFIALLKAHKIDFDPKFLFK